MSQILMTLEVNILYDHHLKLVGCCLLFFPFPFYLFILNDPTQFQYCCFERPNHDGGCTVFFKCLKLTVIWTINFKFGLISLSTDFQSSWWSIEGSDGSLSSVRGSPPLTILLKDMTFRCYRRWPGCFLSFCKAQDSCAGLYISIKKAKQKTKALR